MMSGPLGLMSTVDTRSPTEARIRPSSSSSGLVSDISQAAVIHSASSHSSLPGVRSANTAERLESGASLQTLKSIGSSATVAPLQPYRTSHAGVETLQQAPKHSKSAVHGAIQALRQDLLNLQNFPTQDSPSETPDKDKNRSMISDFSEGTITPTNA